MKEWFCDLDPVVQAAIIGGIATIVAAIIAGVFSVIKRKGKSSSKSVVKQRQFGKNNMQIGNINYCVKDDDND